MAAGKVVFYGVLLLAIAIGFFDTWHKTGPPKYASYSRRTRSKFAKDTRAPETQELSSKTAFVTGASGFLGGHIVEQLLEDGWTVRAQHRKRSNLLVLKELAKRFPDKLSLHVGDITNIDSLREAIPENLGAVFHVAAVLSQWWKDNDWMYRVNVLGTRNVVEVCLEKNVGKLIHTSSVASWGYCPHSDSGKRITEDVPMCDTAWGGYPNTKRLAEREVDGGIDDGLWAAVLNPAAILGKYDTTGFARIATMLLKDEIPAVAPGYLFSTDAAAIAKAHVQAAKTGKNGRRYVLAGEKVATAEVIKYFGELIHKNGDKPVLPKTFLKVYGTVMDFIGIFKSKAPAITSEIAKTMVGNPWYDSQRAVDELGFDNTRPWKEQVKESVQWLIDTGKITISA